jgi:hypothetical protein
MPNLYSSSQHLLYTFPNPAFRNIPLYFLSNPEVLRGRPCKQAKGIDIVLEEIEKNEGALY